MIDQTFRHAVYYFFMNNTVVSYSVTFILSLTFIIVFLTIVKNWGDM